MPTAVEIDVLAPAFVEIPEQRVHAIACALTEGPGVDHTAQDKPWTVWPFREVETQQVPSGSVSLRLRINWLTDDAPPAALAYAMPDRLQIGKYECQIVGRNYGIAPYPRLATGPGSRRALLDFLRPCVFSRRGRGYPFPDPLLVIGSLARRWNMFSPAELSIPEPLVHALAGALTVEGFDGHTEPVGQAGDSRRVGFVGQVALGLGGPQAAVLEAPFATLLRASPFLGVGSGTTRGLGALEAQLR